MVKRQMDHYSGEISGSDLIQFVPAQKQSYACFTVTTTYNINCNVCINITLFENDHSKNGKVFIIQILGTKLNESSSISLFTSIKQDQQYSLHPEASLAESGAGKCVRAERNLYMIHFQLILPI